MSESLQPAPPVADTEEVDALVVSTERGLTVADAATTQAVAVALSGFLAGVAAVSLLHRRQRRAPISRSGRGARLGRGGKGAEDLLQIVASRSLLVDVHLLGSGRGR
ncbi:MAG TPA: hypothetical protein VID48_16480 [Solirubrobacteraceae bacterium]